MKTVPVPKWLWYWAYASSTCKSAHDLGLLKLLQNFQKVKPCMIEKYKPLQSSSAQKCWAFKANWLWSKVNKVVKVPLCSERGLNPKSKSHWCLHLWKVHRFSLHLTDTKLEHAENYCRPWWKVKIELSIRKVEVRGWKSRTWPFRSLWYTSRQSMTENLKPYRKVRKLCWNHG